MDRTRRVVVFLSSLFSKTLVGRLAGMFEPPFVSVVLALCSFFDAKIGRGFLVRLVGTCCNIREFVERRWMSEETGELATLLPVVVLAISQNGPGVSILP